MKLVEIKLTDFRQFLGTAVIRFSTSPENNVTVIHGENGVGKTTILNAIYWCLYGQLLDEFEKPDELVNDFSRSNNAANSARVELQFDHNDTLYRIERVYDQSKRTSAISGFKISHGNNTPIDGVQTVISRIIPNTMAPYFFFHGEGLNSLGAGIAKKTFAHAIKAILGFNHAEEAIRLLTLLKIRWQKQFDKLEKLGAEAREALEEEANAQEALIEAERLHDERRNNLSKVEEALSAVNNQLAEIKIQNVDQLNKQREALEARQRAIPREIHAVEAKKIQLVARFGWAIVGHSTLVSSAGKLKEFRTKRKLPAEYNDAFVRSLLESEKCICGHELHDGSEARAAVEAMLAGASTTDQEDAVTKAIGMAENIRDVSDEYTKQINAYLRQISELQQEKGQNDRRLEEIEALIKEINQPALAKLNAERSDLIALTSRLRDARHIAKIEVDTRRRQLDDARKKKNRVVDEGQIGKYLDRLGYIERVIDLAKKVVSEEQITARSEIEEIINERLSKFSRKDYFAEVNDDFSFVLNKSDGTSVAKSKGEKALLNISFIAALIQLAKKRSAQTSEYFVQGTVAPFVIDAPFGELDRTYRGAVAAFLPESTEQLITLLSSSHWGEAVEENLRPHIGLEYLLISESVQSSDSGKTLDSLSVKGNVYQCARYGMELPRTVVEEV